MWAGEGRLLCPKGKKGEQDAWHHRESWPLSPGNPAQGKLLAKT